MFVFTCQASLLWLTATLIYAWLWSVCVCACTHIPSIIGIQISSHKNVQLLPFFKHQSPSQGPNSMMGNKLKRMALIAHIQINKWRWFNACSDKASANGGIRKEWGGGGEMEWAGRRGGVKGICSRTHGCKFWSTAAVAQPPHEAMQSSHTQRWLCVCVCPSGLPVRNTVKSFCLASLTLPPSVALVCRSPSLQLSIPLSLGAFFKGRPSLPSAMQSSQHPLNLYVHPFVYLSN